MVEAGANLPGEIARYREIIEPTLVIVTNAVAGPSRRLRVARRRGGGEAVAHRGRAARDRGHRSARRSRTGPGAARGAVRTAALERADLVARPGRARARRAGRSSPSAARRFTLAARGLHQADNATRVWAVVEALDLDRQAAARALERFAIPGGRGELLRGRAGSPFSTTATTPTRRASAPRSRRRGRSGTAGGSCSSPGPCGSWAQDSPALHAEIAAALVELDPDMLAAVGEFVAALAPYAEQPRRPTGHGTGSGWRSDRSWRLGCRAARSWCSKASRGVALERILPALTNRATPSR